MAEMEGAAEEVEASLAKALLLDSGLAVSLDSASPHVMGRNVHPSLALRMRAPVGLSESRLAFCSGDSCCIPVSVHCVS